MSTGQTGRQLGARRVKVPRTNVTPDKDSEPDYSSYYSPDTRGLVADWYQPKIALLGYGF